MNRYPRGGLRAPWPRTPGEPGAGAFGVMITDTAQRWTDGRPRYRPAGEPIKTAEYDVAILPEEREARAFVERHHYSRSFPAARWTVGLHRGPELVGVAVFSVPVNFATFDCLPAGREGAVELGRFVLLDSVPGNGETWFLARAFELVRREGATGIVSFSDPMPRELADGTRIFGGHVGTIYQAHNACYLGQARGDALRLLPDGRVFHNRPVAKIRARERGWRPAAAVLESFGAEPLGPEDDADAWLARWLPVVTRRVKHPGNHKYIWALDRAGRRRLPASKPYPKVLAA